MLQRYAIIEGGVAVNITQALPEYAIAKGWVLSETANIGDLWDGEQWTPVPPPAPITIADVQRAAQARLDTWAQERHYDGILSVCSYASSGVPRFAAEAAVAVAARDATWSACYAVLDEIESQARPMPDTVDEVMALLPALTWGDA